jgi:hypothetical protein
MKNKDIALIIVIVAISALFSYFVSKAIFSSPKNRQQTVEVVQPIYSEFQQPDTAYFNKTAFDPTKPIDVGQNTNTNPFNSKTQ